MNKALFWDFHGTLIYSDPNDMLWTGSLADAFNQFGYVVSEDAVAEYLHNSFTWYKSEVSYINSVGLEWWNMLFLRLRPLFNIVGLSEKEKSLVEILLRKQILEPKNYKCYPDAEQTLIKCIEKGYKNYILSNNFPELGIVIRKMNLSQYFEDYIISANVGYEKPREELFQHALKIAKYPDICYMIGDNPISDIQGGKRVGMKTVLVHNQLKCNSDFTCRDLYSLVSILK